MLPSKRILGVCLGHQGLAESFGAKLYNLPAVLHGVATEARNHGARRALFRQVPARLRVGRYHSWAIRPETMPDSLETTARDVDGEILAFRHRSTTCAASSFTPSRC
jgi:anthranilate synthase component 2